MGRTQAILILVGINLMVRTEIEIRQKVLTFYSLYKNLNMHIKIPSPHFSFSFSLSLDNILFIAHYDSLYYTLLKVLISLCLFLIYPIGFFLWATNYGIGRFFSAYSDVLVLSFFSNIFSYISICCNIF